MTMRAEAALIRGGSEIYHFGGRLVGSVSVEVDAAKGRKTRVARLLPIEPPYLKGELSRFVDFFAWSKDDKTRRPIGPPNDVINEMLGRFGQWEFPAISGVLCCPTLRRDGSVLAVPGFDPATGLLVIGPLPDMPEVARRPSEAEARRAIGLLDGLLEEFPFVDAPSRSTALSGMISPVVRGALTCVPMHASSAPAAGTGKSYLFDVDAGIANGDLMHIMARGESTEEMEKR
jgi:putative DNA primase/helicase